jgi:flagellar motor switch protein FliG
MNLSQQGLRKAAVLVACLDSRAADALLDQLEDDEAGRVRQLAVELDDIDATERQRVIDEFRRVGPLVPDKCPPGIELAGTLAARFASPTADADADEISEARPAAGGRPFDFLRQAEADKLVRLLESERPQTIALVLSHLPPERAGQVLSRLGPALQVDVVRRLVDLEETDAEILRDVESALATRLAQEIPIARRRVVGLQAVSGILQASERGVGVQILETLAAHDQSLADRLVRRPLQFEELEQLDDDDLAATFQRAGRDLSMLALLGVSAQFTQRVLGLVSDADAAWIEGHLQNPGPTRLRDVEEARRRVAQLARHVTYLQRY